MKVTPKWKKAILFIIIILLIIITAIALYIPSPSRVVIIGLDAADWDILNPLFDEGRLPNLKRMVDGGVSAKLETFEVSSSPAVWNTISTGVTRETHGILGFQIKGSVGKPYTSNMRRVPAMWNIASHYGRKVGIVGHWSSWPAEEVNGQIVSSYISYDKNEGARIYYKGRLRREEKLPGQTHPPELLDLLYDYIISPEMVTREDIGKFFDIQDWDNPDLYLKADGSVGELKEAVEYIIPWTYAADKTHIDVFEYLRQNHGPHDLSYTYIEGTDVVGHRFWHFHDTTHLNEAMDCWGYDLANREVLIESFGDTIGKYYDWSDEFIGRTIDDLGPRDTLIVLSDHGLGRHELPEGFEHRVERERHTFSGSHSHYGVIIFYGANIKRGYSLPGPPPDLTDVLPTILSLMKLPVARWMEGNPMTDAFTDRFNATFKTKWIDNYGIEDKFAGDDESRKSPLSPEYERRMRALGYLT